MYKFHKNILVIDDVRFPEQACISAGINYPEPPSGEMNYSHIARTFQEGISALQDGTKYDLLLLDHDLASYEDGKEKTGYDVMCFLEENPQFLPKQILCCSSNPVGKQRINTVIQKLFAK